LIPEEFAVTNLTTAACRSHAKSPELIENRGLLSAGPTPDHLILH